MSELDLGWQDVLRRAERRHAPRRRLVVVAVLVLAALGGGPALGVLLTRPGPPQLPADRITGSVSTIINPRTGVALVEWARWKGHNGVCYLVPHVHTGCLLAGHRAGPYTALPIFTRLRHKGERAFLLLRRSRFFVVATKAGGGVKLVKP
jgi:hypothetical protein